MDRTAPATAEPLTSLHGGAAGRDAATMPSYATLFESVAAAVPDEPAVNDGVAALTYRELDERSAALARGLQDLGADEAPVAVLTRCDAAALVTDLGVLRSGRPIVVLDRLVPVPRIRTILEVSGATLLLVDEANRGLADEVVAGLPTEVRAPAEVTAAAGARPAPVPPERTGVIVFTSGSTGLPKGVLWDQRFIAGDSLAIGEQFGYRVGDRLSASFPINFAAGMLGSLVALAWGVTLEMCDPRDTGAAGFVEWLRATRTTILSATPSMLRALHRTMAADDVLPDLRIVVSAGEALFGQDVTAFRPHQAPDGVFVQSLGSSEGGALSYLIMPAGAPVAEGAVPAGHAAIWRSLRVVDDDGRTLPPGEPGELVVATPLLASGYWRDPERSAAKFRRRDDGLWDLRTGDVGVLDSDGLLRLMGRKEAAVKIRGYLVDPSEVEATLLASGRVAETAVIAVTENDVTALVAYVVPRQGQRTASVAELRAFVVSRLPSWMVPAHIVPLRELPRNAGGKIDRVNLPPVPARRYEAPVGPVETSLAEIWGQVLHVEAVGRADDFYALGGDSLAVEEMLVRVEQSFGTALLASDFTRATTLGGFAALLGGGAAPRGAARWPATVVETRPGTSGRPVFCIAGAAQSTVAFVPFAALLDTEDPVVVLQTRGFERHAPAQWSVRAMVRTRLAAIRRLQPHGPYVLVGHSLGAMLALEIGRRLEEQGERVLAVILDPMFVGSAVTGTAGQSFADFMVDPMYIGPGRRGRAVQTVKAVARAALLPVTGLVPARVEARHKLAFRQAGLVARRHRPRPWGAPMLAYRTADNGDPAGLWERLMPNATVHDVPSDHNSLLRTPYIEAVVADLQAELAGWS